MQVRGNAGQGNNGQGRSRGSLGGNVRRSQCWEARPRSKPYPCSRTGVAPVSDIVWNGFSRPLLMAVNSHLLVSQWDEDGDRRDACATPPAAPSAWFATASLRLSQIEHDGWIRRTAGVLRACCGWSGRHSRAPVLLGLDQPAVSAGSLALAGRSAPARALYSHSPFTAAPAGRTRCRWPGQWER
jgi:hypothetical protein